MTTAWPRVVAQCEDMGVTFDPWQHGIGQISLGKRADGKYAATVGGVVLSIPRQVGKTFLVGMIVIALCVLHPGLTVLWTAHRTRTATKTFASLKGLTSRKRIKPHMLEPRNTNGEQELRFRNGSVIMFGAREQGFGRGFEEVDVEVFDEGQILTEKALEDMVPAANQSRHPAGALLFFLGTPPRPSDAGDEFTNRRTKALAGKTRDMVFVEFSADADADLDDPVAWSKANPSFPERTPVESMLRMRENLTDDDSFRREALGIWDDPETNLETAFGAGAWEVAAVETSQPAALSIGLAVAFDRRSSSIGMCGDLGERVIVAAIDQRPGVGWLVAEAKRVQAEHRVPVAVDRRGPAGDLIPALEAAGVSLVEGSDGHPGLTTEDYKAACAGIFDGIHEGTTVHPNDGLLNQSVAGAQKRTLGDRWAWARKQSADVAMLEAVTIARWAALTENAGPSVYETRGVLTL